jgi:phosphoglucosamine mutase
MQKEALNFGGEQSGHVIMHDFAKTGDGLVSALQTLALLLSTKEKASKVLRPFALYPQKLVNIKVKTKKPLDQIEGLQVRLEELDAQEIGHLIRYSGTENKLRILLEAKDAKKMQNAMDTLVIFLEKACNA